MNWPRLAGAVLALGLHGGVLYALLAHPADDPLGLASGEGQERLTIVATVTLAGNDLFTQAAQVASVDADAAAAGPRKRPEEEKPKEQRQEQEPPDAVQEPPPPVEKQSAMTQTASVAASAQEAQLAAMALASRRTELWSGYQIAVHAALERFKIRPDTRHAADVLLAVTIAPSGELLSHSIAKSSGVPELDRAAIASLERAAPFPPIPPEVSLDPFTLLVPFEYRVK